MSRPPTSGAGILAAVVVAVLALAFFGLRPQRVVTEPAAEYPYDPATEGDLGPVVVSTRSSGGFRLLGFQLGHQQHTVSVRFVAPPGCSQQLATGQSWPVANPACTTPYTVTGTIGGLGTTADGRSLIGLDIDVSRECSATVELGTVWPPTTGACAATPSS